MQTTERILVVIAILSVTVVLARIAAGIAGAYGRKGQGQFPSATILANLTRVFIYVLGLLTIFYSFGINITPALTALGIGGLAVALALQDTLSNFFAGLQIIASKQITTGDFIKLNSGDEGYVADITWRYTNAQDAGEQCCRYSELQNSFRHFYELSPAGKASGCGCAGWCQLRFRSESR
jgi:small-conductance mechanosensitive channel